MLDAEVMVFEVSAYKDAPVAFQRFLLRTHYGDPVFRGNVNQMAESQFEFFRLGYMFEIRMVPGVTMRIARAGTELTSQILVLNTGGLKGYGERFLVELRTVTTVRIRAHVHDAGNSM
jgi:hypothetical protein